jgi:uncharacterized protein (DUF2147 family)
MNTDRRISRIALAFLLAATVSAAPDVADIEGRWLSGDGDGWIDIRIEAETLNGYIAGSPNDVPGDPSRLDVENPDAALRTRELDGMKFMQGFRYVEKNNRWTGGTIYDPNSGKTYKGTLTLVDHNSLKLRGYIGVSLFGRNEVWSRVNP